MSVQPPTAKPNERRQSVHVAMAVVHKTNKSEDKKLERRVAHLRQREEQDKARHRTDVRRLEEELESMQLGAESAGRTFSRRETEEREARFLFGGRRRPEPARRKRCRGDSAAAALDRVARNVQLTGKNRFRSAVMAVCVANGLNGGAGGESDARKAEEGDGGPAADDGVSDNASKKSGGSPPAPRRVSAQQARPVGRPRPRTSPAGPIPRRRSTGVRPASTADGRSGFPALAGGGGGGGSASRRRESAGAGAGSPTTTPRTADSPCPSAPGGISQLPGLAVAARASLAHAAESAKAAAIIRRRRSGGGSSGGSGQGAVTTAAERDLEKRRSSAALRLQEIKRDLGRRDEELQDRIRLFVRTSLPGELATHPHFDD